MNKTYKKNEKLLVEWIDAYSSSEWMSEEDAMKRPKEIDCLTMGFFLAEDDEIVRLSSSIGKEGCMRDLMIIPKGMIKKIKRLR
jgi:hypothetical protein